MTKFNIREACSVLLGNDSMQVALAEALAAIVVDIDEQIILGSTASARKLFGYVNEELTLFEAPLDLLIPERYRTVHKEYVEGFREDPQQRRMSTRAVKCEHADGHEFDSDVWILPVSSHPNRAICIFL